MKIKTLSSISALILVGIFLQPKATADTYADFSGGSGAVMFSTLPTSTQIQIQQPFSSSGIGLVFLNAYSNYPFVVGEHSDRADGIFLTGPGISSLDVNNFVFGIPVGSHNGHEFAYFFSFGQELSFAAGDTFVVTSGTAQTQIASPYATPDMAGPYATEIGDVFGHPISAVVTQVPEPSTSALLIGGLLFFCLWRVRRKPTGFTK